MLRIRSRIGCSLGSSGACTAGESVIVSWLEYQGALQVVCVSLCSVLYSLILDSCKAVTEAPVWRR